MHRFKLRNVAPAGLLALALTACGTPAATTSEAQPSIAEVASQDAAASVADAASPAATAADLEGIKTYLTDGTSELKTHTAALKDAADRYYAAAEAANFDYAALAGNADAVAAVVDAKNAWIAASPAYERMEGIVAGVPSLAEYDVILDAGRRPKTIPQALFRSI